MKRCWLALVLVLLVAPGSVVLAQEEAEVPTVLIEGAGLDIFARQEGPSGRMWRGRARAEFDLLLQLERSFVEEIPEDAKTVDWD